MCVKNHAAEESPCHKYSLIRKGSYWVQSYKAQQTKLPPKLQGKNHLFPNGHASLEQQKDVSEPVDYAFIMLILHPTGQNIPKRNLSKGNKIF